MTAVLHIGSAPPVEVPAEIIKLHPLFTTIIHPAVVDGKPCKHIYSITECRSGREVAYGSRAEAIVKAKLYFRVLDCNKERLNRFLGQDPVNQVVDTSRGVFNLIVPGPEEAAQEKTSKNPRYDPWRNRANTYSGF